MLLKCRYAELGIRSNWIYVALVSQHPSHFTIEEGKHHHGQEEFRKTTASDSSWTTSPASLLSIHITLICPGLRHFFSGSLQCIPACSFSGLPLWDLLQWGIRISFLRHNSDYTLEPSGIKPWPLYPQLYPFLFSCSPFYTPWTQHSGYF